MIAFLLLRGLTYKNAGIKSPWLKLSGSC